MLSLPQQVAQKWLVELDPNNAAGYLILLANVYATTKRWQDVAAVRRKMVEMGVKKPPVTTSGIPTTLIGNGSDVLINRAFRTAIKDEVALTLEKAENEVLGHDVLGH
ncbi:hypothetical protein Q3G72_028131 [Acer saccharum]|nr:hypothetical protein Q3G72_028131 [Acer saccharum]